MLFAWVWAYWKGYLSISARGPYLERFLNLCSTRGLHLWQIQHAGAVLQARMTVVSFRRLRPIARQTRTRVHIEGRAGLPFLLAGLERQRGMVAGAALALVVIVYLSGFVWFVEVRVPEGIDPGQVLAVAAEAGLRPGARRSAVSPRWVESGLEARVPAIAQAIVTIAGTRAVVEVVRQTLPKPPPDRRPANVVARKSGLVTRLVVIMGRPAVKENQAVHAGQVLIEGVIEGRDRSAPDLVAETVDVRAAGEVWARVWYQGYEEIPLQYSEMVRTSRAFQRQVMKLGEREIIVRGWGEIPFTRYEVEESVNPWLTWRNRLFRVETNTLTYYEVDAAQRQRTEQAALSLAEARAARRVLGQLDPGAQLISVKVKVINRGPGWVGVHTAVETLEDIGVVAVRSSPGR